MRKGWTDGGGELISLPPDEQAFGFDTNADALTMQPALLDRYVAAAAKIARLALGDPSIPAGLKSSKPTSTAFASP